MLGVHQDFSVSIRTLEGDSKLDGGNHHEINFWVQYWVEYELNPRCHGAVGGDTDIPISLHAELIGPVEPRRDQVGEQLGPHTGDGDFTLHAERPKVR